MPADIPALVERCRAILDYQDTRLVERRPQIHVCLISLVSQTHTILYGNPGNAKSMTLDGVLSHLPTIRLFKTQAYKASTPEQFLGPISFKAMEQDEYRRIITGKIADAEVAYIDEIPRAPRPVLPAFHGLMVEREFDNGAGPRPAPLMSLFGSANHLPDDEELQAFFDRFTFKLNVEPPQSQDAFIRIMRGGLDRRATTALSMKSDPPGDLFISPDELRELQRFSREEVTVPDDILEAMAELWSNLIGVGIQPSIRRYNDLVGGLQAAATLAGRDVVVQDDIMLAQHSLWSSFDEAEAVYAEVIKFASEWEREKADLLNQYADIHDRLTKLQSDVAQVDQPTPEMTNEGLAIVQDNSKLLGPIEKHIGDANGRDAVALQRVVDEMERAKSYVQERFLGGIDL